jgi:hypothetical protein
MRMSLQATPVHPNPVTPLAKQLIELKLNVETGTLDHSYVHALANQLNSSGISERLRAFLYSGDIQHLEISSSEAFKAVVYHQSPVINAPMMVNGEIVPSPALGETSDTPVVYARSTLFPEIRTLYWQDEPLVRVEYEGITQECVLHAPLQLEWEGVHHKLLCESFKRSFYVAGDVPIEIQPWLSLHAQERTNLAVGIRRQGYALLTLTGIQLNAQDVHENDLDLGVCVLSDEKIEELNAELGLDADPYQGTIWFADGTFFKGTIQSMSSAGIPIGWYGGLKRPGTIKTKGATVSTRGSIMDSYIHVPWTPSMNRQQTDYAGLQLPVRQGLPHQDVLVKAASGFPAYVQQMTEQVLSSCAKLFKRVGVRGVAGKVSLGKSSNDVQFIVRGPHVHPGIRRMVFLFSPSLPVHTELLSVRVEFIQNDSMYGNLIQLNVHENNYNYINNSYIRHCGRDADGDGLTLSNDPIVLCHAVPWKQVEIHDTTQYKSVRDEPTRTSEEAIRTSSERVRLYSSKIGVFDKLARRIHRQDPKLMTNAVRTITTEAIQRSISATKKNSAADRFEGSAWLQALLPEDSDTWLYANVHDQIDRVGEVVRTLLNVRHNYSDADLPSSEEYKDVLQVLTAVREEMPEHYQAAAELLSLIQSFPKDQYRMVKVRGRTIWATQQARASGLVITDVQIFIAKSKKLWRSVHQNDDTYNPGFGYLQAVRVIRTWAQDLSERVNTQLLIGAMCTEFSLNLLGHVLDLDDIVYAGLTSGVFIPLSTDRVLNRGMLVTKGKLAALLAHPIYADVLVSEATYSVENVFPLSSTNWIPRTSRKVKQGRVLVQLKEVI